MARRPFFSGNYGSALGSYDTAARLLAGAGQAQGQMFANLGADIGGAIEKYQLNKEKRAKLTGEIEAYLQENPNYINESTMTGDEATDKKNMTQFEKFAAGDLNMAGLEGLAGKLARGDTLRKNKLLEESQMMQNKMQELTFGINKELRDTKVNIEKDKGVLSRLFREREEEQDPAKRELFDKRISETLANLGMGDLGRKVKTAELEAELEIAPLRTGAAKAKLRDVPEQVEDAKTLRDYDIKRAERAEGTAEALLDALGGPEGAAAMTVEERKLNSDRIRKSMMYQDRLGNAALWNALKANAPVSVRKQAAELSGLQGDLLSYKVRDPIDGGQISFEEYLELNNTEGEGDYPLTGDNAGTAGSIYATFLNNQKQIDDLMKTVDVQVVVPDSDGDQSAPAPAPRSTAQGGAGLRARNLAAQQANYRRPEDEEYERRLHVWSVRPPARRGAKPTPPPGYQP
jgi:hypothetical protein